MKPIERADCELLFGLFSDDRLGGFPGFHVSAITEAGAFDRVVGVLHMGKVCRRRRVAIEVDRMTDLDGPDVPGPSRQPRIVPVYLPGSAAPRLEWVNEPRPPRDWGDFVSDTYLPQPCHDYSTESVDEWRRACAEYMDELTTLRAEWAKYKEAIVAGRKSIGEAQLGEFPRIVDLFNEYEAEILDNSETLDAFAKLMLEEIQEVEDEIERAGEEDT